MIAAARKKAPQLLAAGDHWWPGARGAFWIVAAVVASTPSQRTTHVTHAPAPQMHALHHHRRTDCLYFWGV